MPGSLLIALTLSCTGVLAAQAGWHAELAEGQRQMAAQNLPGAEESFRRALKDVRRTKGRSADDIAVCMQSLAGVLKMQDVTEEALPLYKRCLRLLRQAHGRRSPQTVPVLKCLGEILEAEGDFSAAEKFHRLSVDIARREGSSSLTLAGCQHRLGRALSHAGKRREGEDNYRAALSIVLSQPELPSTALLEELLADYTDLMRKSPDEGAVIASSFQAELLKDDTGSLERTRAAAPSAWAKAVAATLAGKALGRVTEEERALSGGARALPGQSERTGPLPPDAVQERAALAQINRQRVEFYERMIAIDVDSLGPGHPSVARDLSGLASLYIAQGKYAEAKPLLARALAIYAQNYGSDALLCKRTQGLIDLIGQDEAGPPAESATAPDLSGLPALPRQAEKLEIALRLNYLALLCYGHGKIADAEKIYRWALADTARACGEANALLASCLADYGRVLRSAGRPAEAEKLESSAHDILRRVLASRDAATYP